MSATLQLMTLGNVTWSAGTVTFASCVWTQVSGGLFLNGAAMDGTGELAALAGSVFVKSTASATSLAVLLAMQIGSTLSVAAGVLQLGGGANSNRTSSIAATVSVAADAILDVHSHSFSFEAGSSMLGNSGTVAFSGASVTVNAPVAWSGILVLSAGSLNMAAGPALFTGSMTATGGVWTVSANSSLAAVVSLSGHSSLVVAGGANLTLLSNLNLGGDAVVNVGAAAQLVIAGDCAQLGGSVGGAGNVNVRSS